MCADEIKQVQGCWASSLGDCAGKLSREHTVSECFWGETSELISVQGMRWCADAPKMVSVASLTAKVLCEFHNNKLGETVDPIAALTTQSIKESMRLLEVRKKMRSSTYNVLKFRISGPLLERWFLKTLINFTELDQLTIRADTAPNRVAAAELVRIAFGVLDFPGESGLWLAARPPGGKQDIERRLQFRRFNDGKSVIGGLFSFCGYHFYMNLETVRPNHPAFNLRQTLRHPTAFILQVPDRKNRPVTSHVLELEWPESKPVGNLTFTKPSVSRLVRRQHLGHDYYPGPQSIV